MTAYADHEAAQLFPLMTQERFSDLVGSIQLSGLLHEIILYEDKILDGRNRYRACEKAGIAPRFRQHVGDPYDYVWSANGQRRDLGQDQRYLIWKAANEKSDTWRATQNAAKAQADAKRSEKQKGNSNAAKGKLENSVPQIVARLFHTAKQVPRLRRNVAPQTVGRRS